jgi:hypothetical protein
MKNSMVDLRNHLFETLEELKDKENPMPVDRALAIAEVASQLIETAKVEVAFIKATDASGENAFAAVALRPLLPSPGLNKLRQ